MRVVDMVKRVLMVAAFVMSLAVSRGMGQTTAAESLIEDFANGPFATSAVKYYNADTQKETIQQSDSTGYGWGGWSGGITGDIKYHLTTTSMTFMSGVRVSGSYFYTIFSTNADGSATHHVTDLEKVIIDMRAHGGGQDVGLLIKDAAGDWYLSTAATGVSITTNTVYIIDISTLDFEQVENPAAGDMDEMDSDSGPGAITTDPSSTSPDLSKVLGGGVYLHSIVSPLVNTTRINSIQFNHQLTAFGPDPADNTAGIETNQVLTWKAADFAVGHDVYLGTSFADINDATNLLPVGDVYRGEQALARFEPADLEYGQEYFWRVDEVNDGASEYPGIYRGPVWSFTTIMPMDADVSKYRGNNQRTGYAVSEIPAAPVLLWTWHQRHAPRHAWKEPGHEVQHIDFDYADQAAIGNGMVFFGSSGDHKVYALDAGTGQVQWEFFTEGPVRFAPVVDGDRLFAVSDDGFLYCLEAASGTVIWKFRGGPRDEKLIGNDNMISRWPGRSGVMVDGDKLYFAAGMWARDGAYIYCMNADDGSVVWKNDTANFHDMLMPHSGGFGGIDPQGYLVLHRGMLYVATGRGAPAAFDAQSGELVFYENGKGYKPHYPGGSWLMAVGDYVFVNRRINNTYREVGDPFDAEMDPMPGAHCGLMGLDYLTGDNKIALTCRERAVMSNGGSQMIMAGARLVDASEDPKEYIGSIIMVDMADILSAAPKYEPKSVVDPNIPDPPSWVGFLGNWRNKMDLRAPSWFTPNSFKHWETDTGRVYNMIEAGNTIIAGGRGKITALNHDDGAILWTKPITGNARGLCVADGKLIVSSTDGYIYCYGEGGGDNPAVIEPQVTLPAVTTEVQDMVTDIVQDAGVVDGYALVLGAGDGTLIYELTQQTNLVVYCLEADPNKVSQVRQMLDDAGVYGVRSGVHLGNLDAFSYVPYFANLIVWDSTLGSGIGQFSAEEMYRVLRPYGGVARQGSAATAGEQAAAEVWLTDGGVLPEDISTTGQTIKITRGDLPGAGEWTHPHANIGKTSSSDDSIAKAPLGLLWIGGPGSGRSMERHRRSPAPLFSNGVLAICGEHDVYAVDAYTGRELWNRRLPRVGYYPFPTDFDAIGSTEGGRIIADRNHVYCVQGAMCLQLNLMTGETVRQFAAPSGAGDWQYMGVSDEQYLIGIDPNCIFVYDTTSGDLLWRKTPVEAVSPLSIVADSSRIYYLDQPTAAAAAIAQRRGEFEMMAAESTSELKVCDIATGTGLWTAGNMPLDTRNMILQGDYLLIAPDQMQAGAEPDGMSVYSSVDGSLVWSGEDMVTTAAWRGAPYLSQTVVVGDTIYTHRTFDLATGQEQFVADPVTGEDKPHMFYGKNFCGAVSANDHLMFYRSASIGYVETDNVLNSHWIPSTRPNCWISVIPAGGIVLSPDSYGVCNCSYSYKTSFALYPVEKNEHFSHCLTGSKKLPSPDPIPGERVRHLRANLGAVGDRRSPDGRMWMAFPSPTSPVNHYVYYQLPMSMTGVTNQYRYNSDSLPIGATGKPWLYTSGGEGALDLTVTLSDGEPHTYKVSLHFAETGGLAPGQRVFDVKIQGTKVLDNFDIAQQAGGDNIALVKTFDLIEATGEMTIKLIAQSGAAPSLSAVEIIEQVPANSPDINNDGEIDYMDFAIISAHFWQGCVGPLWCEGSDLDAGGSVDPNDIRTLAEIWVDLP